MNIKHTSLLKPYGVFTWSSEHRAASSTFCGN